MQQYDETSGPHDAESWQHGLMWGAQVLWSRRRFVMVVTVSVAVMAVLVSLLIPNEYRASARVLPPEGGGSSPLAAMLSRGLPSGAASLLGGGGRAEYTRYLALLSSRTMRERVVDEFDLVSVYGLEGKRHSRERAVEKLTEQVTFTVDSEYRYLSVSVLDVDPRRAADMANFYVQELNRRNAELSAQNASLFRRFVEHRYNETLAALDSVKNAAQEFQQRHGVFDVEAQSRGFFEQTASLRAKTIELEIEHETMLAQFGPDHPHVRSTADAIRAANRRYQDALAGGERLLPVAQEQVPAVMREYFDLEQERLMQTRILELVGPLYEQARFDEERETQAVQVVDYAVPPVRKATPKRSILVVSATVSAIILSMVYVWVWMWWVGSGRSLASNLRNGTSDSFSKTTRPPDRRPIEV